MDLRKARRIRSALPKPVSRDALQRGGRVLQKATSRIQARSMDELGRGHPRLSMKGTSEVPGAHLGMPRKRLDRGILLEVTQDPLLRFLDRRLSRQLCREMRRELRLPAGTLQEQDHVSRDGERKLATEIFFDQRKRQIHAGADTRGRA